MTALPDITLRTLLTCEEVEEEHVLLVHRRGEQVVAVGGGGRVERDVAHVQSALHVEVERQTLLCIITKYRIIYTS